jgi:uncharacterized damage-inducible protein DinB
MKNACRTLAAALLLIVLSVPLAAQGQAAAPAASAPTAPAGIQADLLASIQDAEDKLLALAEATPAEKLNWRPAEGVRTTGEVFAHVAAANYFLPTFWGVKMPEGVDPRSFEKSNLDKAGAIARLRQSFEHARAAVTSAPAADLDKGIELFGRKSTQRGAMLVIASHAHEHLGQAIAYARMNGIAPPWSRGE